MRVFRAGATVNLDMTINAKIVGNRVYNGATQTWSGSQSGDSLPAFQAGDWLIGTNTSAPNFSADVTSDVSNGNVGPTLVWEINADQGIPAPAVIASTQSARVRIRMR